MSVLRPLPRRALRFAAWLLCACVWLSALPAAVALASDCPPDDPSRSDCQAAAQTAQNPLVPIAGAAAGTVIAVIVNGILTSRTELPPAEGQGEEPSEEEPTRYTLDLRTEGQKTRLATDGEDTVRLYGQVQCNKPEVDTGALTRAIGFAAEGPNADWLLLDEAAMLGGAKSVTMRAWPPSADAQILSGGPSVSGSVLIEGRLASGQVRLTLDEVQYETVLKFEPDSAREYHGIKLGAKEEFVGDGEDELAFAAYVRQKGKSPEKVDERAQIKIRLEPEGAADYQVQQEPHPSEPGKVRGRLKSARPLLNTSARASEALKLRVEAKIQLPDGQQLTLPPLDVPVRPRLPYLKLWVVPGGRQGTSEAGAFLCLAPNAAQPLRGAQLELQVVSEGSGGSLTNEGAAGQTTDRNGLARWTLAYSGLNWQNIFTSQFKIRCTLRGPSGTAPEGTWVRLNVGRNAQAFVTDIDADQKALDCTNPYFQSSDWQGISTSVVDTVTARAVRGAFWNLRCSTVGEGPATENRYVCQKMRDRIYDWMQRRRFGAKGGDPDALAVMNGLEISQYSISPVHVFAGFHLSGTGPDDDPRMIDPWWKQEWGEALTWREELVRTAAVVGPFLVPLTIILAKAVAATAAFATVKAWLLGSWAGYAATAAGATAVSYGGYRFLVGAANPNVSADGHYAGYRNPLVETAIRWRTEGQSVGVVNPAEPW